MNNNKVITSWRYASIAIALLLVLTAVLYQQTFFYLSGLWNNFDEGEYAHGYLVLAISAYLIFCNRERLAKVSPCPSYTILPLVLLSSLSWLVAVVVDVEMLQSVGLLLVIITMIWAVTGHQAVKLLMFPLLFIAFAIPVWFPLSPLLQDITADAVFWIARLIEVPAFRQENLIVVPAGVFSIEEACSGLRYLMAALTLGSLYAYMSYVTLTARIIVVLVAAATALVANILRVFLVVYVGYTTDMQHPWVTDHLMLGWYIFGGLVVLLLFLDSYFYRHGAGIDSQVDTQADTQADAGLIEGDVCNKRPLHLVLTIFLSAVFVATGPVLVYLKNNQQDPSTSGASVILPDGAKGWVGPVASNNDWLPRYQGSVSEKADYQKQAQQVSLFIAYYPRQKQGAEVINVTNQINNAKVWRLKYTRAQNRRVFDHDIKEQLMEDVHRKKRLVWYWYDIGGQVTTNKYEAKVLQLMAMLKGEPQAHVTAVSVEFADDLKVARDSLRDFIIDMKHPIAKIRVINNADELTGK